MKLIQLFLTAIVTCALSLSASAQWQWVDKDGRKIFSDRPPPADIPEKNIVRQPNMRSRSANDAQTANGAQPAAANASAPKSAGVDKELAEKAKQKTDAEEAKRKQEEERIAKMQAESCARARQAMGGLSAGVRVARTNDQGEREFLDEAGRAQEASRIQAIIDQDCK
jgi:hypothetical protein